MNLILYVSIYIERDSFGAPWWEDTQDVLLGENPAISLEGIRWWVLKSCFSNFKCHVQRKNGRCQCCSRCGPRFMKFDGVNLHIPYEKSRYFWSNSQFKVSIEVVPIITPHFIATCLNLLFWHKSCLSSWTHHMQFEVFVHFSIAFLGCFLDLLGPSDLSSRARANTTFFFTVTFESYGLSWTWRSLPVSRLCCFCILVGLLVLNLCKGLVQTHCFCPVSWFHCHHSFTQSFNKKWGYPLYFKPNSWDWSCKIISNKSIDKKSTYI